jgi:hypothetical protein
MLFEALCFIWHTIPMRWAAYFHPRFKTEFDELAAAVQDELPRVACSVAGVWAVAWKT